MPDKKDNTPQPSKPQPNTSEDPTAQASQTTNRPSNSSVIVLGDSSSDAIENTNRPTSGEAVVESVDPKKD